jgi:tetratricopeptide (TPR) repeat protein
MSGGEGKAAIEASQRLQARLEQMIAAAEAEETRDSQQEGMRDTQVGIRRYGLQAATKAKEAGNACFTKRQWVAAIKQYSGALDILDKMDEECGRIEQYDHPVVKPRWELRLSALNNRAEAYLRIRRWAAALVDVEAVLVIDPYNVKALSRRRRARDGQAEAEAGDGDGAEQAAAGGKQGSGGGTVAQQQRKQPHPPKPPNAAAAGPPGFWEFGMEQWPTIFAAMGRVGRWLHAHRGKLLFVYLALTLALVQAVRKHGVKGLMTPRGRRGYR